MLCSHARVVVIVVEETLPPPDRAETGCESVTARPLRCFNGTLFRLFSVLSLALPRCDFDFQTTQRVEADGGKTGVRHRRPPAATHRRAEGRRSDGPAPHARAKLCVLPGANRAAGEGLLR